MSMFYERPKRRRAGRKADDPIGLTIIFRAALGCTTMTAHKFGSHFDLVQLQKCKGGLRWGTKTGAQLRKVQSETLSWLRGLPLPRDNGRWRRPSVYQVRPDPLREIERAIAECTAFLQSSDAAAEPRPIKGQV